MLTKFNVTFLLTFIVVTLLLKWDNTPWLGVLQAEAESLHKPADVNKKLQNEYLITEDDPGEFLRVIMTPEQQTVIKGGTAHFTVVILNTSSSVDLVDVNVTAPFAPDCNKNIGNLAANSNFTPYSCSLLNVQNFFANEVLVQGSNPINNRIDTASSIAAIDLLDMRATIIPQPSSIPEPGGNISFTVSISNTGSIDFEINELTSVQFGDLTDSTNPAVLNTTCNVNSQQPVIFSGGKEFICSFLGEVSGQPSEIGVDVTVVGIEDSYGNILEKDSKAVVDITDIPASISVSLSPNVGSVFSPGGLVEFSAAVENTSSVDSIIIENLIDSIIGEVSNKGTCFLPQEVYPGEIFNCIYQYEVLGDAGEKLSFVLTANGKDDDIPAGEISNFGQTVIEISEPPVYTIFFPGLINFIDEPNNNCSQLFPINVNQTYYFWANDTFDLYEFTLAEAGDVTINLTNFLPQAGQLIAYRDTGSGCASSQVLANNADAAAQKTLALGVQEGGRYFILVLNEGQLITEEPYQLEIIFNGATGR